MTTLRHPCDGFHDMDRCPIPVPHAHCVSEAGEWVEIETEVVVASVERGWRRVEWRKDLLTGEVSRLASPATTSS